MEGKLVRVPPAHCQFFDGWRPARQTNGDFELRFWVSQVVILHRVNFKIGVSSLYLEG